MATSEFEQIDQLVEVHDWLVGAVNYDEDLHFSSYYLRASVPHRTATFYPGYSCIFAFYEEFSERYYLRTDECISNAQAIIKRAVRDPYWLEGTLDEIIHRSDRLCKVFDANVTPEKLRSMRSDDLTELYKEHHVIHSDLYTYARIPEALDRGVNAFTNYLKNCLSTEISDEGEREEIFIDLTQPVTPSILAQEILDFDRIVRWSSHDHNTRSLLLAFPRKAHLLLSPSLVTRIEGHVERWKYLDYHGYGSRHLTSRNDVIERLVLSLQDETREQRGRSILSGLAGNRVRKEGLFQKLKIDQKHRALFELYPEIGAAKLYRRYAQLRNFFYLDMLLEEISRRLDTDEWTIRCMLPEEIMKALTEKADFSREALERRNGCMMLLWNDKETIHVGDQVRLIQERLNAQALAKTDRRILKGVIASRGRVQGTCKIVIRNNGASTQFEKGGILVSEATDPDLLKFLKVAGGVLTQQGGVTSHAALICREIGIPAIIGIEGLLERVKDGDVVELDAYTGEVRLVGAPNEPPSGLLYEPGLIDDHSKIGSKAANLALLSNRGFNVPPFVLLQVPASKKLVLKHPDAATDHFLPWIERRLGLKSGETVAIRSSSTNEDLGSGSRAGEFESVLDIPLSMFWNGLSEFLEKNELATGGEYSGSIIVQRMIKGAVGGVCLTRDTQNNRNDVLILEVAPGGSQNVTGGRGTPRRISFRRDTRDILEDTVKLDAEFEAISANFLDFVRTFLDIEDVFGKPLDIEWVWNQHLYIVQARPIVTKPSSA